MVYEIRVMNLSVDQMWGEVEKFLKDVGMMYMGES